MLRKSVVRALKTLKRQRMILEMVNKTDCVRTAKPQDFQVGDFVLRASRSCEDVRKHLGLSGREMELLMWVAAGFKKREIAARMGVTTATADTFRRRAYAKLGVGTGAAAVAIMSTCLAGAKVEEREPASI